MQKTVTELDARVKAAELENAELKKKQAEELYAPRAGGNSNSDERKAMSYFGCSHVKSLLEVNTNHPRFAHVPAQYKHLVRELKNSVDTARFVAQHFHGGERDFVGKTEKQDRVASLKNLATTNYGKNELSARLKAFGSTVVGAGDEWVPTLIASSYIDEFELEKMVEGRMVQVDCPSSPYQLPVKNGVKKARKIAENTAITDVNFGTTTLTFTASKLGEYYIIPEELDEDSAVSFIPMARDELVRAHLRAVESAIINGDNDGTHIDSDTQALGADVLKNCGRACVAKQSLTRLTAELLTLRQLL